MIKINQLKLPVGHSQKDLEDKIRKTLRIPSKETFHYGGCGLPMMHGKSRHSFMDI